VEAYTFSSVNKLVAYDSGDGTVATYHYDALGRRIAKVVDGAATAYVYEEWNPYSSVANDILLEYADGVLTRRWLHGSKVDEPLAFEAYSGTTAAGTGSINEVYADRQGSILAVVDPVTGTKAAEYTYDSFGQLTQVSGVLSQPFAYTAREYDAETGLYYYRARYYDPALGQFVSADPIGFAAGDLNIYTYVENDPFNWTDPSGLQTGICKPGAGTPLNNTGPICGAGVAAAITPGLMNLARFISRQVAQAAISGILNMDNSDDDAGAGAGAGANEGVGAGKGDGDGGCEPEDKACEEEQEEWSEPYDWTDHAIDEMMDENISPDDVYDAIENPIDVRPGSSKLGPTTVYEGARATAVLNALGRIVTVWRY